MHHQFYKDLQLDHKQVFKNSKINPLIVKELHNNKQSGAQTQQNLATTDSITFMIKTKYQKYLQQLDNNLPSIITSNKFQSQSQFPKLRYNPQLSQRNKLNKTFSIKINNKNSDRSVYKKQNFMIINEFNQAKVSGRNKNHSKNNGDIQDRKNSCYLQSHYKNKNKNKMQDELRWSNSMSPYKHQAELLKKLRKKSQFKQIKPEKKQQHRLWETRRGQMIRYINRNIGNTFYEKKNSRKPSEGPKIQPW